MLTQILIFIKKLWLKATPYKKRLREVVLDNQACNDLIHQGQQAIEFEKNGALKKNFRYFSLALVIIGFVWIFYEGLLSSYSIPAVKRVPVSAVQVNVENRDKIINLHGTADHYSKVSVQARIDSQVVKLHVKDGQDVKKNDLLMELDSQFLLPQITEAKANIVRDQSEVDRAEKQYDRDSKLVKKGATTQEQHDTSKKNFDTAKAALDYSKANLEYLEIQLGYTKVRAPLSGVLGILPISEGCFVKAYDTKLATISQASPIFVNVSVPQKYYDDVVNNMRYENFIVITKNKDGQILDKGKVSHKENEFNEHTRTLDIQAVFENKDKKLWPNMFVDVDLVIGKYEGAIVVPTISVRKSQNGNFIFIIRDGRAIKTPVSVLEIQGDDTIIQGTIEKVDVVITNNFMNIVDGSDVVHIHNKKTEKADAPGSYQSSSSVEEKGKAS